MLSELDRIQSRFVILRGLLIVVDKSIEDGQNLAASVTLSKQRKHHGLGHDLDGKVLVRNGA